MKRRHLGTVFCLLSFLTHGCLVGPNYIPPNPCIPDEWHSLLHDCEGVQWNEEAPLAWWETFDDPLLNQYIALACCYNNMIWGAYANVLQARAIRQVTASQLYPQIDADFSASRTYFSKNGPLFSFTDIDATPTGLPFQIQVPQIQNLYNALINASWELDFFGRIRRSIEAADASIGAAIEERNSILISVFSEVARNYIEIRSYQKRGQLIEQNLSLLERNALIARKRLEYGYSNRLDLARIEAEISLAQSDLPIVYANILRGIYALSVLTGSLPETLVPELAPIAPLPKPPCIVSIGLRSDLLRRRPDIREAERQLAAATANIGVAVASFYPSFTLSGNYGFQSLNLRNLFEAGSRTWSIGGNVNIPIYQGGQLVGNLRLSEAEAIATAYNYQQTVLEAVQDAESALISYTYTLQSSDLLKKSVEKNRSVVTVTNERYTKGLIDLINLLDSERQLNRAEQSLLQSETDALIHLVNLYQALGGGWGICL
jgi:multidrug efflux system outer membrane protein